MTIPYPLSVHVTPAQVRAVIDNPYVTLNDLDVLIIWIGNEDSMGVEDPLYMEAMELQSAMILRAYLEDK